MGYLQLKTEIPGPKSKELVMKREQVVARGIPIGISNATGALVTDLDCGR